MVTQKKVQQNFDVSFLNPSSEAAQTTQPFSSRENIFPSSKSTEAGTKRKHAPKSDEKQVLVNFYMAESEKKFYKEFFKKDNRTLSGGILEALKCYYELNKERVEG